MAGLDECPFPIRAALYSSTVSWCGACAAGLARFDTRYALEIIRESEVSELHRWAAQCRPALDPYPHIAAKATVMRARFFQPTRAESA